MRITNCEATPQYISWGSKHDHGMRLDSGAVTASDVPVTKAFLDVAKSLILTKRVHVKLTPEELDYMRTLILLSESEPVIKQLPKPAAKPAAKAAPQPKRQDVQPAAQPVVPVVPVVMPPVMSQQDMLRANADSMTDE